jgi:hypothetical protein
MMSTFNTGESLWLEDYFVGILFVDGEGCSFQAHDEEELASVGDIVRIVSSGRLAQYWMVFHWDEID